MFLIFKSLLYLQCILSYGDVGIQLYFFSDNSPIAHLLNKSSFCKWLKKSPWNTKLLHTLERISTFFPGYTEIVCILLFLSTVPGKARHKSHCEKRVRSASPDSNFLYFFFEKKKMWPLFGFFCVMSDTEPCFIYVCWVLEWADSRESICAHDITVVRGVHWAIFRSHTEPSSEVVRPEHTICFPQGNHTAHS